MSPFHGRFVIKGFNYTGCFGHYATLRRHDANLTRQEQAMEWLTTYDRFSSAMFSDGDFSLNQYLPYTLVPFFPLFQEKGGERVERNQADWEVSPVRSPIVLHFYRQFSTYK